MSSPKRRIETDVMKLMMSDYEVTLVNDNMQEFYVIFKGPGESEQSVASTLNTVSDICSTICRRKMESSRRITRPISLQVAVNRLCQPHISPQY